MAYNPGQIEQIRSIYRESDGNAAEAARQLPFEITGATIRNYWDEMGFPKGKSGGNRYVGGVKSKNTPTGEYLQRINRSYHRYDGNPNLAARSFDGITAQTIERCWRAAGLKIHSRSKFGGLERKIATPN